MEGRTRRYDHSNWSPSSGRTWTYSSGDASEQCAAFMEAINSSSSEAIKDESLREEVQLWLQRFASIQLIGTSIHKGKTSVPTADQIPRVAQIPLEFDPPRVKRWSADDEALRQHLIDKLAESMHLEEWMTSADDCQLFDSVPSPGTNRRMVNERLTRYTNTGDYVSAINENQEQRRRRLSSQLSEAFHIFARSTDLPRIVTTTANLNY
ncbi:hypothetical protein BIW11_08758 [Tropilaelaps mercedesae]|uniref:Uncharacterized protein n=1 Tax=Tropilaelaps mercedesae TaxID=418985 RepID=A0A1V9XN72_9ACAR|nr:hypothetical protein BIW11_08758 [Tropilaelaps mercedesae]